MIIFCADEALYEIIASKNNTMTGRQCRKFHDFCGAYQAFELLRVTKLSYKTTHSSPLHRSITIARVFRHQNFTIWQVIIEAIVDVIVHDCAGRAFVIILTFFPELESPIRSVSCARRLPSKLRRRFRFLQS